MIEARLDFDHVLAPRGQAMIANGLAQVLDRQRQIAFVGLELIGVGQVDEAANARLHQLLQALPRLFGRLPARIFAGKQQARDHPIAIRQR
jgi:hypothetical protein